MKRLLLLFLFLTATVQAFAQYFDLGQDPSSFRWKQIRTDYIRVIYPEGSDSLARSLCKSLQQAMPSVFHSLNARLRPVSVILHPASVTSNAMVPLAPHRMEFYTCPPQDAYAQPWLDQLALHELRHVAQIERVDRKFSRALRVVFGDQGTAAVIGLFVPFWFLEGDAVCTETVLSKAGRGRDPAFEMEMRATLIENGLYSFEKTLLGSYKDYLPDHYVFGYHMVAAARRDYGPVIWENALEKVARSPYFITPFNYGIRRVTGLSRRKLYMRSFTQLRNQWLLQDAAVQPTAHKRITPVYNRRLVSFTHSRYPDDSCMVYVRGGMDEIKSFRKKRPGMKEKKLLIPGRYDRISLSAASGKVVWNETRAHPRWEQKSWSVIRIHDLKSGKTKKLLPRTRLFATAISNDGSLLASVEQAVDGSCTLVVHDTRTAERTVEVPAPENSVFLTPAWMPDGRNVVAVVLNRSGKSLVSVNLQDAHVLTLIPFSFSEIIHPFCSNDYIFFSGSYSGIMDIYALRLKDRAVFRVSRSRFGAFWPSVSPDQKRLSWSEYSSRGYYIAEAPIDTTQWEPLDQCTDRSVRLWERLDMYEASPVDFDVTDTAGLSVSKYSQLGHALRFHSWGPLYIDADNFNARPGLQFMSQNLLSNLAFTAGYEYNLAEEAGGVRASIAWKKWFPVMEFGFSHADRSTPVEDSLEAYTPRWTEDLFRLSVRIPLNLSSGRFFRYAEPLISGMYYRVKPGYRFPENFFRGSMGSWRISLYAYNQTFRSEKDLFPSWAQYLNMTYQASPNFLTDFGSLMAAEAGLYFPGLMKHHSLNFYTGYQRTNEADYSFAGLIAPPRGLKSVSGSHIFVVKTGYDFPVCYPEFRIAALFYMKRLRAGIFCDAAAAGSLFKLPVLESTGVTLLADFHLLRIMLPFTAGARISYLTGSKLVTAEFVYSISLGILGARKGAEKPADFRNRRFEW